MDPGAPSAARGDEPLNSRRSLFGSLVPVAFFAVFLAAFLPALPAPAAPKDVAAYDVVAGGFADIRSGAFIEGSVGHGGTQPDYVVDTNAEPLKSLLAEAAEIGRRESEYWNRVGLIVDLVREKFRYTDYFNPFYRRLMKKYRDARKDVPLHEYLACGAGVCREHALVLHFALKAAGVPNRHSYARIYRASKWHGYEITEDHAFTVVKRGNVEWVVDAYYWGFNGFRLRDLMSPEGITERSPHAPIADPAPGTRRIVGINAFPVVYNPKNLCSKIFD